MPRKRKEVVGEDIAVHTDTQAWENADTLLDTLSKNIDIPDDVDTQSISRRDMCVFHLVATAELHRFPTDIDMQRHRIQRCITIADLVIEMLGDK